MRISQIWQIINTDSKSWANPKEKNPKQIHTKVHYSQTSDFWKLKTKKKNLDSVREKHLSYKKKGRFLIRNHEVQKQMLNIFQMLIKTPVYPKSYNQQKQHSGRGGDSNIFRWRKTKGNSYPQIFSERMA